MEKRVLELKEMAERILLNHANQDTFHGWEFRKGKTTEDINKAVKKGLSPKNSFGKFEFEVNMVAVYLKDVLKKKRVKKVESIHRFIQEGVNETHESC